ncbi:MAG: exosortase/archaeosortase family protein [bacterium]
MTGRRDPAPWLLAAATAALYGPLVPELIRDWRSSGDFSHGPIVPLIAGLLLWVRKDAWRAAPSRPFLPGLVLLGLALAQYLLGVAAAEFYLQRASVVPFLLGWALTVWGPARARVCVFPVAFLLFMIPVPTLLWTAWSLPLQLLATRAAGVVLDVCGVSAVRTGNVLHLPGCTLEVAHACSGLRSLMALLAMAAILADGSLLGDVGPRRPAARVLLVLAAVPVAIATNALRVSATAVAVARTGPGAAAGWLHELTGLIVFAAALGILWGGRRFLGWIETSRPGFSRPA